MKYVALIDKAPDSDYWVHVPDIPGCYASGATAELALDNFCVALKSHLENPAAIVNTPRPLSGIPNVRDFVGSAQIDISTKPATHSITPGMVAPIARRFQPQ